MPQKLLRLIRKFIDFILDDNPEEKVSKQTVIAVEGDLNITVTGDNNNTTLNLILPNNETNVKHFSDEKATHRRSRTQERLECTKDE